MKTSLWAAMGGAGLLASALLSDARAQSADALIDKLIEKGILTVKEGNELREEADKNFTTAYQVKSGIPDWVASLKWSGDLRGRYEGFYSSNPTAIDRNRFQYRLRAGFTVSMFDQLELGARLSSVGDTANNPISSNQTLDNNASKKGVGLDLAYGKWSPVDNAQWSATFTAGKMENPFVVSPVVIDRDYTPEGLAEQFVLHLSPHHHLRANLGQFVLEERSTSSVDSYLFGGQLLWDATWNTRWQTSLGFTALGITGKDNLTPANGQLNVGEGNTRVGGLATNPPAYRFNPLVGLAEVTWTLEEFPLYSGPFPIRLSGEYLNNPGAPDDNEGFSVRLVLGKAGKRRQWDVGYEYRELQADAIYEELPESDFNAFTQTPRNVGGTSGFVNGTNIRGHIIRVSYSLYDGLLLQASYWITENIMENPVGSTSGAQRLQLDATWRF